MNELSVLPVGYKPTQLGQIRYYCSGNNGYFVKNAVTKLGYDWRTTDGVLFSQGAGMHSGVGVESTNIHSGSKNTGFKVNRLGNKSERNTFFYGDHGAIQGSTNTFADDGTGAFIPHAVGIAFKFSKEDTRNTRTERKQNNSTECRIQQVAGVYVDASTGSNNGKIYSYNYGTVASGSLGFNASGIETNDKFCCYLAGNSTGRSNINSKPLLLIGWLFDLNLNHNGTGEQNPSGHFWQARPIISFTSHNGTTGKPDFLLAYPFESAKWEDVNPKNSGKVLKFNQRRV